MFSNALLNVTRQTLKEHPPGRKWGRGVYIHVSFPRTVLFHFDEVLLRYFAAHEDGLQRNKELEARGNKMSHLGQTLGCDMISSHKILLFKYKGWLIKTKKILEKTNSSKGTTHVKLWGHERSRIWERCALSPARVWLRGCPEEGAWRGRRGCAGKQVCNEVLKSGPGLWSIL